MEVVVQFLFFLLVHFLPLLIRLQLDREDETLLLQPGQLRDLDAGHRHVHLPHGQQTPLEVAADGEELPLGRLPPEHGARPGEGDRELLQPELPCDLVCRVQFGALRPVVHRVVVLEDEAQDGLHVGLVLLWVDLVGVPDKVNVVAGNNEGLGVLPLEVEIHLVPPEAVHVELLVAVVGQ